MISDPWFYVAAVPALLMTGFSKSGFVSGAGMLGVPILSLVISPVQAVGIMLPLLLVSDVVGVANYWRDKHALNFKILFVAALVGSGLGWATAAMIPEDWVRIMVGVLGTAFSLDYWLKLRPMPATPPGPSWGRGLFWGGLSAYASFITQAAGPPLAVYLMPQRLAPAIYAATAISILTCMNLMKVVPYYLMGQLNAANLATSLVLMPLAVASVYIGLWLVRRIPSEPFYKLSYGALLVVSLKLMWDGVTAIV